VRVGIDDAAQPASDALFDGTEATVSQERRPEESSSRWLRGGIHHAEDRSMDPRS
jgi:hypothetical protein